MHACKATYPFKSPRLIIGLLYLMVTLQAQDDAAGAAILQVISPILGNHMNSVICLDSIVVDNVVADGEGLTAGKSIPNIGGIEIDTIQCSRDSVIAECETQGTTINPIARIGDIEATDGHVMSSDSECGATHPIHHRELALP